MLSPLILSAGFKRTSLPAPKTPKVSVKAKSYKKAPEPDISYETNSQDDTDIQSNKNFVPETNSLKIKLMARTGISISRISYTSCNTTGTSALDSCQNSISSQHEEQKPFDLLPLRLESMQRVSSAQKLVPEKSFAEEFMRTDTDIRNRYIGSLQQNKMLGFRHKNKCQAFVILDWEGTIYGGTDLDDIKSNDFVAVGKPSLKGLDKAVCNLLGEMLEYCEVFISTSYNESEVLLSARLYMPQTYKVMQKRGIQVICTRSSGVSESDELFETKKMGLMSLMDRFKPDVMTNMICVVDSHTKIAAMESLANRFDAPMVKILKFKEYPKVGEMIKQQEILLKEFENIFFGLKSFTLHLSKKKI